MIYNSITQTAIKSDKDLQNAIKHSKDKRILDSKTENELETLATNPHLLELENTHKYETQTLERQTQFFNSIERTKDELTKGDFVAKENIKQDIELINLIKDNLENNTVFTPENVAMNIIKDEKTYTFMQDKHGISYIYELPREKPTPPRTYDELRAKENADNAELQSYKDQTQTIIEKRKLTRYEPQNNATPAREAIRELNPQEIENIINSWDLSKEANNNAKQRQIIGKVSEAEAQILQNDYNFKNKKELIREIDSHQVIHALKQHGDESTEAKRGQIAINKNDIANYHAITQDYDLRIAQPNGKILYAKQINGHCIVLEEVLIGQDKIRFFDMWKQKGQLNKDVLLSHSQRPNTTPSLYLDGYMPNNTYNNNINLPQNQDLLNQITEKQKQLQQIETKLNNQTTQKGKSYYTQQLENLNKEIQQLEINAGIRTELNLNNSIKAKKQALQDAEYTITTNDNQKLIFTENEMDNIKKALLVEYITEPKELSPNFKHSLDSKV